MGDPQAAFLKGYTNAKEVQIESLQIKIKVLEGIFDDMYSMLNIERDFDREKQNGIYIQLHEKLEGIEDLKSALEKYADKDNWSESDSSAMDLEDLWDGNSCHGWSVAQQAIADLEKSNEKDNEDHVFKRMKLCIDKPLDLFPKIRNPNQTSEEGDD